MPKVAPAASGGAYSRGLTATGGWGAKSGDGAGHIITGLSAIDWTGCRAEAVRLDRRLATDTPLRLWAGVGAILAYLWRHLT